MLHPPFERYTAEKSTVLLAGKSKKSLSLVQTSEDNKLKYIKYQGKPHLAHRQKILDDEHLVHSDLTS
jgi:hypothetical protein